MVQKTPGRGKHRKRSTRAAWPGMMLHQDASTHDWVPGVKWDWVVTMDDATNEHYSMRLVAWQGHGPRLGIEMIPAYSPEARGCSERMFRTHQGRVSATGAGHRRHPRHDSG